ncbi:hypothetical protein Tco_1198517, partial [Tanacetum coccineum]
MHCFIEPVNGVPGFFCSFVYACVNTVDRRSLWKSLIIHKGLVKDRPWTILGDFNALFDEICNLTKMTSADEFINTSFNDTIVKIVKGKPRKPHRGIKVSTPGSAGAGSVLRRVRSAKVSGKARGRVDESLVDNRGGKRSSSTPVVDEVNRVLSDIQDGNIKFDVGSSTNVNVSVNKASDVSDLSNDGSFIKRPLVNSSLNDLGSPVAKSCGLKTSHDHTSMGDVGNTGVGIASSKDGIAIAKTGILS